MKKLIAFFIVMLVSCTVVRSPYFPQQTYWGTLAAQTAVAVADQAKLALAANKNGLKDSAEYYSRNVLALTILGKQYTDSLIFYINKK